MSRTDQTHLHALSDAHLSREALFAFVPHHLRGRLDEVAGGERVALSEVARVFSTPIALKAVALLPECHESGARLLAATIAARTLEEDCAPVLRAVLRTIRAAARGAVGESALAKAEAIARAHDALALAYAARTRLFWRDKGTIVTARSVVADVGRVAADRAGHRHAVFAALGYEGNARRLAFHRAYAFGRAHEEEIQSRLLAEALAPRRDTVPVAQARHVASTSVREGALDEVAR